MTRCSRSFLRRADYRKMNSAPAFTRLCSGGSEVAVALTDPDPVAQVFKTMAEEHFGELSFFRVYSGTVSTGMELFNANRNITERIGQIYVLNGRDRMAVGSLSAGDIGAVVKLKDTHTGNTL